jgi:hypothetical protein
VCDDGEACTTDACVAGVGCRSEPLAATEEESATCGVENLETILARPPAPACTARCASKLDRLFTRVRTLIAAAADAPPRRCTRKLNGALATAARLRRTIHRLAGKGQTLSPPERAVELEDEAERLVGRIVALRDSCAGR